MLEQEIETNLVTKLKDFKYSYRPELNNRSALEENFRDKFEELNRIKLTDGEFARLLDEIITPDVFATAILLP
jgi:type I restriction enzyme R subunit